MSGATKYCTVCERSVIGAEFVRHGEGWRHTFCAPPPGVEQMIEDFADDGWVLHGGRSDARPVGHEYVFWLTGAFRDGGTLLEDGPDADGATATEALTNLHAAWRERRNDG